MVEPQPSDFGGEEGQVELRGPARRSRGARVSSGERSAGAGHVLEGEHHLEQRRAAAIAVGCSAPTSCSNGRSWWA